MFYFGQNDELVYPEWSIHALNNLFQNNLPSHINYKVIEGASHSFTLAPLCYKGPQKELPYSPEFLLHMKSWVLKQLQN
jgi:hypothetical protein